MKAWFGVLVLVQKGGSQQGLEGKITPGSRAEMKSPNKRELAEFRLGIYLFVT